MDKKKTSIEKASNFFYRGSLVRFRKTRSRETISDDIILIVLLQVLFML